MSPIDGKTCLVTGAAGFLGLYLIDALRERGCPVRAFDLVASPQSAPREGVRWIEGDILDREVLRGALEGVEVVFHTAAIIELARMAPRRHAERVRRVNVEGTRAVVEVAQQVGVQRLVHTSSTNVVFGEQTHGGDEQGPYSRSSDLYSSTKAAAEQVARAADREGGLRVCAIRPGGIYGPGERRTIVGPLVDALVAGYPVVVFGNGRSRLDFTYIDNVVDGLLRAADRLGEATEIGGQAYFVTDGSPINPGEFSTQLVRNMGLDPRVVRLPRPVARTIAFASEGLYRWLGTRPPFTVVSVDLCTTENWFRIDGARQALGYAPLVDTQEGLRRAAVDARTLYDSLRG